MTTKHSTQRTGQPVYYLGRPAEFWLTVLAPRPAARRSPGTTAPAPGRRAAPGDA